MAQPAEPPTREPPASRRGRIFYGWWIVLAGFGIFALGGALLFHAFGAYVQVLEEEFGWSRTQLSIAFALQRVESGFLGPVQGWAVDRYGPRRVMWVGITLFGLAFMAFSQVNSLLGFYLVFALIAIGSSLGSMLSISVAIVNWFRRRRALALGVMSTGVAVGGLFQPALVAALDGWGWRTTAFVSGLIVLGVGLPLASLVRHRPEDHGWTPDGDRPADAARDGRTAAALEPEVSFTTREAIRTRAFWLISLGHAAGLMTVGAISVHLFVHVTEELDMSSAGAARLISLMTAMLVVGMLIGGALGDRIDKRVIIITALLGHAAAMLLLAVASQLWLVTIAVALQGLSWGSRGPLTQALRAEYFGPQSFGKIMGFSSLIIMSGMMFGPLLAGVIYDATGTYAPAFTLLALGAALGALCFVFTTRPEPPRRPPVAPRREPQSAPVAAAALEEHREPVR